MKIKIIIVTLLLPLLLFAQNRPYRVGTTAGNFLEIGYGSAGAAMGDAYVTMARDISSIYWNPAGLAYMTQNEVTFVIQPWVVDINSNFVGAGIVVPEIGTLAFGVIYMDYGKMDVTTVANPEGTGELFSASDYALSLSYGRKLTDWFAFGATGKYVGSKIWHTSASAIALDLGVSVTTGFFSTTGERQDGMRLAMSISNYGTHMQYNGIDLLQKIDISTDQGNYGNAQGQLTMNQWELPLIFRIGVALTPFKGDNQQLTVAMDALHPNNNAESVNLGMEYQVDFTSTGRFYLRTGYKGLFLGQSSKEFGMAFGGGFEKFFFGNLALKLDYAYRDMGELGKVNSYSIGFLF